MCNKVSFLHHITHSCWKIERNCRPITSNVPFKLRTHMLYRDGQWFNYWLTFNVVLATWNSVLSGVNLAVKYAVLACAMPIMSNVGCNTWCMKDTGTSAQWIYLKFKSRLLDFCLFIWNAISFMQPSMGTLNSPSSRIVKDSTPSRRRILRYINFGSGES